jgi:hypothetical protein
MTKNRNNHISVVPPKVTNPSTIAKTSDCSVSELSMAFLASLFALVTLSGMTKNSNDSISVAPPKVAKASTMA